MFNCKAVKLFNQKVTLSVNTNLSTNNLIHELEREDELERERERERNNFRFKRYINGIVEMQNVQDFILRLSVITSLFVINCPRLLMDWYFLNKNENENEYDNIVTTYLTISITEQILLASFSYYFVMKEDLDGIYDIHYDRNIVPNLIVIAKIEAFWAKYFSLYGIALALNNYFIDRYMGEVHMYILLFSIFKLYVLYLLKNKKIIV